MANRSGEVIRDYELIELVGRGGFASVYRARHRLVKRTVAIKIIHPDHFIDDENLRRFQTEAQVVARLDHPHIVTLYEFWIDEHGAYLVMQWMANGSLEQHLRARGRLSPGAVTRLMAQIAPALALVHRKGIVHRDLKPANILLDQNDIAHIGDFGIAQHSDISAFSTPDYETVGTPAYMSPEQASYQPDQPVTYRADIYSLGIIAYELLTGQHPFGRAPLVEMMLHQLRDPLPSLRQNNPDLPEALEWVIHKASAKKPEDRYDDAISFAEALKSALSADGASNPADTLLLGDQAVRAAGDLHARLYARVGAVIEEPRRLLGRDDLVYTVQDWLTTGERVLLHGMAGIGKTALAGSIAANYVASGGKVIWVELGRQNADTLFEALARAFEKQGAIAATRGDERIAAVRALLLDQGESTLLVIDNIWNEQAVLPALRAVPHTMPLLMTSRYALSVDGIMLDVDTLPDEAAVELLRQVSHRSLDSDAARDLCALLGNHPFALEMAAKRLQVYRTLTPERLLADIQTAPHSVVLTGALGIERQRSVKDLLDESVNELVPALRQQLALMGGLATNRASVELFTLVAGCPPDEAEQQLSELERRGLLRLVTPESGPAHYRLHDLTYSYVNSLFQRERRPVRQIVDGVLSFVRQHLEDYNALDFDLMNILGVVHNGIQPASHEVLLEIMRLLVVDGEYFSARGHTPLSVSLLEEAIHSAEQVDTVLAHYLLSKLGVHQVAILGDSRAALASYRQALAFAPNDKRRAIILSLMGITAAKLDLSETVDFFDQAYKLACESRDDYTLSTILEQRGYYNATQENYAESRELFSQALRVIERLIAQQQGDWKDLGKRLFYALNNLAAAEQMLGNFDEALLLADRAQRVAEDHGNYLWMADVLVLKGENYHAMGNSEDARTHLLKGLQTYRSYGAIALAQQVEEFLATNGYDESTAEA